MKFGVSFVLILLVFCIPTTADDGIIYLDFGSTSHFVFSSNKTLYPDGIKSRYINLENDVNIGGNVNISIIYYPNSTFILTVGSLRNSNYNMTIVNSTGKVTGPWLFGEYQLYPNSTWTTMWTQIDDHYEPHGPPAFVLSILEREDEMAAPPLYERENATVWCTLIVSNAFLGSESFLEYPYVYSIVPIILMIIFQFSKRFIGKSTGFSFYRM